MQQLSKQGDAVDNLETLQHDAQYLEQSIERAERAQLRVEYLPHETTDHADYVRDKVQVVDVIDLGSVGTTTDDRRAFQLFGLVNERELQELPAYDHGHVHD